MSYLKWCVKSSVYFISCILLVFCNFSYAQRSAFDDAVARVYASQPERYKKEQNNNWHSYASYKDLYTTVDYGALVYALVNIMYAYASDDQQSDAAQDFFVYRFAKQGALYCLPSFVTQGIKMGNFIAIVCMICFKTLLYKTLAKMVLVCGEYDFFKGVSVCCNCIKSLLYRS